jgi:regulator of protease activity HflC (stomatin/prohibitin superfamily)
MENFFKQKWVKTVLILAGILIVFLIFNPFSCVPRTNVGVRTRFGGVVGNEGIAPGLTVKTPLIETIKLYTIKPQEIDLNIKANSDGAITRDNQTIGMKVAIFYAYDPSRIIEMAKNYSEDALRNIIVQNSESAVKAIIGSYDIFEVAKTQIEVSSKVHAMLEQYLKQYPVILTDMKLTNYDWSDEFDKQIALTMEKAQQVKQKDQELQITQLEAQKKVKEAEAEKTALITKAEGEKQATITAAEAEKQAAILGADAKAAEGEGIRKYNQSLAATLEIQLQLRKLDIEMTRVQKWNGQYVPNNRYGPIPVDTKGGIKGTDQDTD